MSIDSIRIDRCRSIVDINVDVNINDRCRSLIDRVDVNSIEIEFDVELDRIGSMSIRSNIDGDRCFESIDVDRFESNRSMSIDSSRSMSIDSAYGATLWRRRRAVGAP